MILQKTYRFFGELSISIDSWILERMFDFFGVGHSSLRSVGLPHLTVRKGAKASVGKGFRINNRFYGNALSVQKCAIWVGENAELTIGEIGGGCYIMDTDFHSSDPEARKNPGSDRQGTRTAPVTIRENAFIGASSIILKGTVIGRNSIIGAGSVVTGNVPDNQLWAGNPARFIKQL